MATVGVKGLIHFKLSQTDQYKIFIIWQMLLLPFRHKNSSTSTVATI